MRCTTSWLESLCISWQRVNGVSSMQAEKQKAAAIKAAQEKAAQDYEREVQQLNAMKLQNEARINEKVRKAKQKARKKEEVVHTEEVYPPSHFGLCHGFYLISGLCWHHSDSSFYLQGVGIHDSREYTHCVKAFEYLQSLVWQAASAAASMRC